jgi:hypothetical protein
MIALLFLWGRNGDDEGLPKINARLEVQLRNTSKQGDFWPAWTNPAEALAAKRCRAHLAFLFVC